MDTVGYRVRMPSGRPSSSSSAGGFQGQGREYGHLQTVNLLINYKDGGMWQNIQGVIPYRGRRKEDKRMFHIFVNVVLNFNLNKCYLLF